MNDPVNNSLPPQSHGHGHGYGRVDDRALQTVLDFMLPGVSFEQAVQDAIDAGALSPSDLDPDVLAEQVAQMPPGHQRLLADNAQALPPALREALDQLGLARQESPGTERAPGATAGRADNPAVPQAGVPLRGEAANAAQALARGESTVAAPVAQANGTLAAQSAAPAAPAAVERAHFDGPLAQGARVADGSAVVRADLVNPAFNPERVQPVPLQALPQQAVLAPQGRTDAMPAQVLPQAAGATVLAGPQGAVLAPNAAAPVPRGAESAQGREGLLAPAGHTLAASLRRDRRQADPRTQRRHRPGEGLLALLPGRRRQAEGEEEATSFQWLFWLLTIVAYGALAVAIIAMIPSGGGLTDGFGRPGYGAYALVVGAVAAAASWFVGRRLSKR